MAKKKKKAKKAKSPPKPDRSLCLSDEEQAAQQDAAARDADAEAAATAAEAARQALDAPVPSRLQMALADGRIHRVIRAHALRNDHHSPVKRKRRKKADIRGSEVKLFREATDSLPALLKDAEIAKRHFHQFSAIKEAAQALFGHDVILCRPSGEEGEDAWWRELEAEDRGDHESFHAPRHIPITDDKEWLDTIKAWDRFASQRYERKAQQFSTRYASTLAHPTSDEDVQRTLDEVWEFAERPENLKGVTDDLLKMLVQRCSLEQTDDVLISGIRAAWRLADANSLMAIRLQSCGYVQSLVTLLQKGVPDPPYLSDLKGLNKLRGHAHAIMNEKHGATRHKHGFLGRRIRAPKDRNLDQGVAFVATGALLCFARQCRNVDVESRDVLEVLDGVAQVYVKDDHLALLALGGLYDVFGYSRRARRNYIEGCGLFALSDLCRRYASLETARYSIAVALRLCAEDPLAVAGLAANRTPPGLAEVLRACVALARACARACSVDGLRDVAEDASAASAPAPAPAPAPAEGPPATAEDARALEAPRDERRKTLVLATRAAHTFLTLRAAAHTTAPGLAGDVCAQLVAECAFALKTAHDGGFDGPARVASSLFALALATSDAAPKPEGVWFCLEQLVASHDAPTQLALATCIYEIAARTPEGRAAVVGKRAFRRTCRVVTTCADGAVVAALARTLALVAASNQLPAPQCIELASAFAGCARWQQCLLVPTRAGARTEALVYALVAFMRCAKRATARADPDAIEALVGGVRLCCEVGSVAAQRAGRSTRDKRVLEIVCRACLCGIRVLLDHSDPDVMPLAKELLKEKESREDDDALRACRRDILAVLWRVSVDREYRADPELRATPSALALALDRLTFSQYGTREDGMAAQCATLLLWLVCHSRRHRKRLERMHRSSAELADAPAAALASDRSDGVAGAALFAIQWLAAHRPRTKAALARSCARGLGRLVALERSPAFRKDALHALLNLSTGSREATGVLAEHCLVPLVDVATAPDDMDVLARELAVSTLSNLQRDARARFLAYCQRLDAGFAPVQPRTAFPKPEATPESLPVVRKQDLTRRYERWFHATFPETDHVPRLMRPYGPPQPSRPQSATYRKNPGKASQQWGRNASSLWTPEVNPEKAPYFMVRAVREPIPPRPKSAPSRRRQTCAALDATRPRAGSHRVGPAGPKGSVPTEQGHDPWTPLVVDACTEQWPDEWSQSSTMVAQQLDKTCVVAPGGKPHSFTFNEAAGGGKLNWDARALKDTHLCAFKHVRGSVVGSMFPSFAFQDPDGGPDQRYHLHHASRVPCEVLDPGAWIRPREPELWDEDGVFAELKNIEPAAPKALEPLSARPATACPRCHRHHMPHLRSLELLGHSRAPLGMLPRYTLHLLVEFVPPPPKIRPRDPVSTWRLDASIYAPRLKECDSRGFYNADRVHARMLASDLKECEAQPRWPKFVHRLAGALPDGSNDQSILDTMSQELLPMYRLMSQCMEYYGYRSSNADPFDMSQNAFFSLLRDAQILSDTQNADHTCITSEVAQRIFVQVNVEVGCKDSRTNSANDNTAMMRHELLEALLRIASAKGNVEKHAREHPEHAVEFLSDALHHLLRDHLLHLPHDILVDADEFRRRRLYREDVDHVLLKHERTLRGLFELYAAMHPVAGRTLFGLKEWFLFVEHSGLYARSLSRSEATHAFVFSRMKFIDESAPRFRALSWVSFLEALVRLIDRSVHVPSLAHMRELGCTQTTEFYEALTHHADHDKDGEDANDLERVQRYMADDVERSLAERVALTLMSIFQNHAIKYRGTVRTETHSVRVGQFLSSDQQDRWFAIRGYRTRRADVEVRMKTAHHQAHVVRRDADDALETLGNIADDVEWAREHGHSVGGVSRLNAGLHKAAGEHH